MVTKLTGENEGLGRKALIAGLLSLGAVQLLKPAKAAAEMVLPADFADPITGFSVTGRFAQFYEQNGGLPIFGRPLSNVITAMLENGQNYRIQWFERARFEYHPENSFPNDVELGQFGRLVMNGQVTSGCSGGSPDAQVQPGPFGRPFSLPRNPNLETLPSMTWDRAPLGSWFHPLFKPELFTEANGWNGAYPWYATFCSLLADGGHWDHWGNPGQWVFYHTQQNTAWQLAVLTTAKYLPQFLAGKPGPAQLNIRTAPGAWISLIGPNGDIRISVRASDMGDVSINLPAECRVTISCASRIHDYNGETIIWMGPTGRTCDINLIDGPQYQW